MSNSSNQRRTLWHALHCAPFYSIEEELTRSERYSFCLRLYFCVSSSCGPHLNAVTHALMQAETYSTMTNRSMSCFAKHAELEHPSEGPEKSCRWRCIYACDTQLQGGLPARLRRPRQGMVHDPVVHDGKILLPLCIFLFLFLLILWANHEYGLNVDLS